MSDEELKQIAAIVLTEMMRRELLIVFDRSTATVTDPELLCENGRCLQLDIHTSDINDKARDEYHAIRGEEKRRDPDYEGP